jgi:hypothetical protein
MEVYMYKTTPKAKKILKNSVLMPRKFQVRLTQALNASKPGT